MNVMKKLQLSLAHYSIVMAVSLFVLLLFAVASIALGATRIPLKTILQAIFVHDQSVLQHLVVVNLRLPRMLATLSIGAAFAVAGAIMQALTHNPMADTGLLGLNAGAALGLAIRFAFFPNSSYTMTIAMCLAGASLGSFLVQGTARLGKRKTALHLVLSGAAINALLTALSQCLALVSKMAQDILFWTIGGVAAVGWDQVYFLLPGIGLVLMLSFLLSDKLSLLGLGEDVAQSLGVNVSLYSAFMSFLVVVMAGLSVSVVGSVGFVGLLVPHIVRFLVGQNYRQIIPLSAVLGAVLLLAADLGAKMLNPPNEIPIGALVSLVGVPFFLFLIQREKYR
jgi:iron complex transport system permease protein